MMWFLYQLIITIFILYVVLKRYQSKPGTTSFYTVSTHTMKKNNFHAKALISHDKTELIGMTKRKREKIEENKSILFIANIY